MMARAKTKDPTAAILHALEDSLATSEAVRIWREAVAKVEALKAQKAEVDRELADMQRGPQGIRLVDMGGTQGVELDQGRRRVSLSAWAAQHERDLRAQALLEGREVHPSEFDTLPAKLMRLREGSADLERAAELAQDQAKKLQPSAQADVARKLRPKFAEIVAAPLIALLEQADRFARANADLRTALWDAGLSSATIPGINLSPLIVHTDDMASSKATVISRNLRREFLEADS